MKVAIIDDGISLRNINGHSYEVVNSIITKAPIDNKRLKELSHGSICAYIIKDISNIDEFTDIKILDAKKRGNIDDLVIALNWCLENKIKLINMSIGTLNYHDSKKLELPIKKLINAGSILVAAIHNTGLITFPAFCDGVIAVRYKEGSNLNYGEYSIDLLNGFSQIKSFVAQYRRKIIDNFDNEVILEDANSYSTAVMTGVIINYLREYQYADLQKVSDFLYKNCERIIKTDTTYKNYLSCINPKMKVPVIEIDIKCFEKLYIIKHKFMKEGYKIEVLTDVSQDESDIPPTFYCGNNKINIDILSTFTLVYKPDIILCCLSSIHKYEIKKQWELIDIFISEKNQSFNMTTFDCFREFKSIGALYEAVKLYFNN